MQEHGKSVISYGLQAYSLETRLGPIWRFKHTVQIYGKIERK